MAGKGRPTVYATEEARIAARRANGRRAYYKNTGRAEEIVQEKLRKSGIRKQFDLLRAPIREALKTNDADKLQQIVEFIHQLEVLESQWILRSNSSKRKSLIPDCKFYNLSFFFAAYFWWIVFFIYYLKNYNVYFI